MKISIIGSGYVGLTAAAGFCKLGHKVTCVDIDEKKVKNIELGNFPLYEPGIKEVIYDAMKQNDFSITTNLSEAIYNTEITFITIPTPEMSDGKQKIKFIDIASKNIGKELKKKRVYHLVVVKSTVVPETTEKLILPNLELESGKKAGGDFGLCVNPEFLREGEALKDFLKPDRIIIGEYDKKSGDILESVYKDIKTIIMKTDLKTAEMIKYASNTFLASKISLTNEIGNICKKLGIDTYEVMKGVGLDHRISAYFLRSGIGFGGSCFKKDIKALINKSESLDYNPKLIKEVIKLNENQPYKIIELLKDKIGSLKGEKISLLGVSFKENTDDIRESPAIPITTELIKNGAKINIYDPKASNNFKKIFPNIHYFDDIEKCLFESDACLILSDWEDFRQLSDKHFSKMKNKIIIEGRRILNPNTVNNFEGVCW
jgi:UDPglucose 6-dehydrogenase